MSIKCESCKWYHNFKPNFQMCMFFDGRRSGSASAKDCEEFKQLKLKPYKRQKGKR